MPSRVIIRIPDEGFPEDDPFVVLGPESDDLQAFFLIYDCFIFSCFFFLHMLLLVYYSNKLTSLALEILGWFIADTNSEFSVHSGS